MATSDSLIQVKNLKKHYHRGAIKALDGVTADINKGDVMAVSYTHLELLRHGRTWQDP